MKNRFHLIFLVCVSIGGCAKSPILNHLNADDLHQSPKSLNALTSSAPGDCPLSYPKAGLCAAVTWIEAPDPREKLGSIIVRFWNTSSGSSNGPFVRAPMKVFEKSWMASMGHGPKRVELVASETTSDPGITEVTYRTNQVKVTMPGEWQIKIQLGDDNTMDEEAYLSFSFE